jgi:hypothetical protein
MAGTPRRIGPSSARVAANLRRIRREREVSTAALSKRLDAIAWPILDTGITKTEKEQRKVDVDDLVALALALGVTPNRLLLPDVEGVNALNIHVLTAVVHGRPEELWQWAQGERPLHVPVPDADSWLGSGEHPRLEFSYVNRPYLTALHAGTEGWVPASDTEARVLHDLAMSVLNALLAGRTQTEVRRIVELTMVIAAREGPQEAAAILEREVKRKIAETDDERTEP